MVGVCHFPWRGGMFISLWRQRNEPKKALFFLCRNVRFCFESCIAPRFSLHNSLRSDRFGWSLGAIRDSKSSASICFLVGRGRLFWRFRLSVWFDGCICFERFEGGRLFLLCKKNCFLGDCIDYFGLTLGWINLEHDFAIIWLGISCLIFIHNGYI